MPAVLIRAAGRRRLVKFQQCTVSLVNSLGWRSPELRVPRKAPTGVLSCPGRHLHWELRQFGSPCMVYREPAACPSPVLS